MSDIADRVRKIVIEHLDVDAEKVTEKASFIDDLGADSLDTVELVMAFEEEFSRRNPRRRRRDHPDRRRRGQLSRPRPSAESAAQLALGRQRGATMELRRVVVTGLGMVTPLGCGVETTWANILAGKSGAGAITTFDVDDIACQIAHASSARADRSEGTFNPDDWMDPKEQRKVDRSSSIAMAAATQALARRRRRTQDRGRAGAHRRADRLGHRRPRRHRRRRRSRCTRRARAGSARSSSPAG